MDASYPTFFFPSETQTNKWIKTSKSFQPVSRLQVFRVQNKPSRATFGSAQKVLAASPAVFWIFKLSNGQDVLSPDGSDDRAEFCKHAHSFLLRAEAKTRNKMSQTAENSRLSFYFSCWKHTRTPPDQNHKAALRLGHRPDMSENPTRTQRTSAGSWSKQLVRRTPQRTTGGDHSRPDPSAWPI